MGEVMATRPRIKVCGTRRVADARLAVELGATHVGCVLAPDSPRCATLDEAREIAAAIGPQAVPVLVFRRPRLDEVEAAAAATGIRAVQVHGAGEGTRADQLHAALRACGLLPYRVYSLEAGARRLPAMVAAPGEDCPAVLDVGAGGAGRSFDWTLLGPRAPDATFIAGGVTPDNLSRLLEQRPWGVDLSSGVESAPGIKDPDKLRRLFEVLAEVQA